MATKCEWNGKPAYVEDDKIILLLNDDKLWQVIHKLTGFPMMGEGVVFKQKKPALAYAQEIIKTFELNFTDKEGMFAVNGGRDNCVKLRNDAWYASQVN